MNVLHVACQRFHSASIARRIWTVKGKILYRGFDKHPVGALAEIPVHLRAAPAYLRDEMGYDNLTYLSATDCAGLEAVHDLCSTSPDVRGPGVPFSVRVPEKVERRVPCLRSLYRSADFRELQVQV